MKPIKTALLSFGMSGQLFHAPFIHTLEGFELYAVCERSKNVAAAKFPSIKIVRNIDEIFLDKEVELVIVNTPNYTHFDYTKKALNAGKHVIVEKPFTTTSKEAEELILLAKEKDKRLSIYQNRRYDSDYKTVKKVLSEGWLGEIVEAEIHYDRYKPELSPKVHKETPGAGSGALYDLGSHLIDQALQLFGMPKALFADIQIVRPHSRVDDFFELLLFYDKKRVRLRCSYLVREQLPGYIFHGSDGSFIKAKTDVQENDLQSGNMPGSDDWGTEPDSEKGLLHAEKNGASLRQYISSERGDYGDYYKEMYHSIRLDKPVPVSADDGLSVILLIEMALKSNRERKVIALNF